MLSSEQLSPDVDDHARRALHDGVGVHDGEVVDAFSELARELEELWRVVDPAILELELHLVHCRSGVGL